MQNWLGDNLWAVWLGIALVLGVVEAVTVDLVFLMLAGGALVGCLAALLGAGYPIQIVVAGVCAAALLGIVRPIAKRRLTAGTQHVGGLGVERYVGRRVVVTADATDRLGYAVLDGDTWSARVADGATTIPAGAEAVVRRVHGASLLLDPVTPARDAIHREERP